MYRNVLLFSPHWASYPDDIVIKSPKNRKKHSKKKWKSTTQTPIRLCHFNLPSFLQGWRRRRQTSQAQVSQHQLRGRLGVRLRGQQQTGESQISMDQAVRSWQLKGCIGTVILNMIMYRNMHKYMHEIMYAYYLFYSYITIIYIYIICVRVFIYIYLYTYIMLDGQ